MINYINIEIPQLLVLPQSSYSQVLRKFAHVMNEHFLWSYLDHKMAEYSIKHHFLNQQLREIFLAHNCEVKKRIEDEYYSLDNKHFQQLFQTQIVCRSISEIVGELCYCIYFMKHLQENTEFPEKINISAAIHHIKAHPQLSNHFMNFNEFIAQTEEIRQSYHLNAIRPAYDLAMVKPEPVYFIEKKEGSASVYFLGKFIEQYKSFFKTSLQVIQRHSPKAIVHNLERWKEIIEPI
jgi:uncharacterized protein YsxB (DUF464 family)